MLHAGNPELLWALLAVGCVAITPHFTRSMVWFSLGLAACASWRQAGVGAELHEVFLAGALPLSPGVNFSPHSSAILKTVQLQERNFGLPLALWSRCGDTKPGYQRVVLLGTFSPEFCYRPSPHHSLLKHMKASISFSTILFNGITQVCRPGAKYKSINPAAEYLGLGVYAALS